MEDRKQVMAAFLGKKCSLAKKVFAGGLCLFFGTIYVEIYQVGDKVRDMEWGDISLSSGFGHWVLMSRAGEIIASSEGNGFNMEAVSLLEDHTLTGMYIKEGIISLVFGDAFQIVLRPYDQNEFDTDVATVFEKNQAVCSILTSGEVVTENTIER